MSATAQHVGSHGAALARVEAELEANGCGPTKTPGFWRCPVPGHGKGRGDRHPSLAVGQGREGATFYCKAGCEADAILDAIGLDFADAFDFPHAKRERTRSTARLKAASATQSTKRETRHEVEVIGPPTAAQVATMIRGRRITRGETLARAGAQHVRARFRDEGSGEWRGWGEYLGLPALGSTWMLYGIRGDGGEWLDDNGKLHRFSAGPCSIVVSPDLRERNGARLERLYDFEGAPDLLAWIDCGGVAAIASTGGAGTLGGHDAHTAKLSALDPREVVILRDLDDAGRKGGAKASDWWLHHGVAVRVPTLPDALGAGGDVRDFLTGRSGGEALGGVADLDALADATELRTPGGDGDEEPQRADALDLGALGFSGASLRALRQRVEPVSPLLGILDSEPHLHVLLGKPKTAKTTFALDIARAWAQGLAPWTGAAAMPGTRALVISREQPVTRLDATLRRLANHSGLGDVERDRWADRVVLVGRDRELPPEGKRLLTLDDDGLAILRGALDLARAHDDPFGFVLLDSLSRLKPPGVEENDNDALTAWLDALEEIAIACGVWLVLIHHQGHTSDAARGEARSAGRGASSIAGVAQVVLLLERVKNNPRLRRLDVDGNAVLPGERFFEVAGKGAEAGAVHFFRPADPTAGYDPKVLIGADSIGVTELARRACGLDAGAKPAGKQLDLARRLLSTWQGAGLLDVVDGSHGPVLSLKGEFRG